MGHENTSLKDLFLYLVLVVTLKFLVNTDSGRGTLRLSHLDSTHFLLWNRREFLEGWIGPSVCSVVQCGHYDLFVALIARFPSVVDDLLSLLFPIVNSNRNILLVTSPFSLPSSGEILFLRCFVSECTYSDTTIRHLVVNNLAQRALLMGPIEIFVSSDGTGRF